MSNDLTFGARVSEETIPIVAADNPDDVGLVTLKRAKLTLRGYAEVNSNVMEGYGLTAEAAVLDALRAGTIAGLTAHTLTALSGAEIVYLDQEGTPGETEDGGPF